MFNIERKRFYSSETEKELNKRYFDLWEEVQGTWEDQKKVNGGTT